MKVFVVGISDAEGNSVVSIHKTYKRALKSWDEERLRLIKEYERLEQYAQDYIHSDGTDSSYISSIFKLHCEDPTQIDNYPHETPYIAEFELEE